MSFEIPEQAKYRITGGVVVLTVLAFVLPSLMAKSNQRFEENLSLHLKVPPKPKAPVMHIPTAQQVFDQVKPGKIIEPQVAEREVKVNLTQAMPLEKASYVPALSMDKAVDIPTVTVKAEIMKPRVKPSSVAPKPMVAKKEKPAVMKELHGGPHYEIQLGAFSHRKNAEFLVSRLNRAGYSAHFKDYYVNHQKFYQVLVGNESNKTKAIALRKQLAQNLQIQGIIVTKG
jgi:DedD protein